MIKFITSTKQDVDQIQKWTDADEYHRGQNNPKWWLTGQGFLSFCLYDNHGPVFYVRIDDGEYARLNVQFAPVEVVPKGRLVKAMLQTFPKLIDIMKSHGSKGFIFSSNSPALISFMSKVGFREENGDYRLTFGE